MQKRYRNIIPNMDLTIDFQCSLNSLNFFIILLDVLYLLSVHEYLKCVFWLMSTNYVCVWFKFTGHVKDPLEQETWIDKLIWTSNNVWVVSGKVMLCWQKIFKSSPTLCHIDNVFSLFGHLSNQYLKYCSSLLHIPCLLFHLIFVSLCSFTLALLTLTLLSILCIIICMHLLFTLGRKRVFSCKMSSSP